MDIRLSHMASKRVPKKVSPADFRKFILASAETIKDSEVHEFRFSGKPFQIWVANNTAIVQ